MVKILVPDFSHRAADSKYRRRKRVRLAITKLQSVPECFRPRSPIPSDESSVTNADFKQLYFRSQGICEYCGVEVVKFEFDHAVSVERFGENTPVNCVFSCVSCNRRKASKHIARFAAETVVRVGRVTPRVARILKEHSLLPMIQPRMDFGEHDQDKRAA